MSLNREDLALYDYAKITFIHPVINAQWHGIFGLPFFYTPCTVYIVKLKSKSAFTTDKYTSKYKYVISSGRDFNHLQRNNWFNEELESNLLKSPAIIILVLGIACNGNYKKTLTRKHYKKTLK